MNTITKITILFFLSFFTFGLGAQCPTGDVQIGSQADVDAFKNQWPNCTEINGKLTFIADVGFSDLSNFSHLTKIDELEIINNVEQVNIDITIYHPSSITNVSGLTSLSEIRSIIIYSDTTTNISGFNNLVSIEKIRIIVGSNSKITGFNNLEYVEDFMIGGDVQNVSGLIKLKETGIIRISNSTPIPNNFIPSLTKTRKFIVGRAWPEIYFPVKENLEFPMRNFLGFPNLTDLDTIIVSIANIESFEGLENFTTLKQIDINSPLNATNISFNGLNNLQELGELKVQDYNNFGGFAEVDFHGLDKLESLQSLYLGTTRVVSLDGLESIRSIELNTNIYSTKIENLSALNGLEYTGNFIFISNPDFNIQSSLNNLKIVNGDFKFDQNNSNVLSGFDKLEKVNGDFLVKSTTPDFKVTGFNKLNEIVGSITFDRFNLKSLEGFKSLSTIGNKLTISKCPNLESLEGLNNLISTKHLIIEDNENLFDCSALCNLFQADGVQGIIEFNHNPSACSSQSSIESECEDPDGFNLKTQGQVDDFVTNYSNKATISGDLIIGDNEAPFTTSDITDISGLSFIKTLIGDLYIGFNSSLQNLNGLENLTAISGDVIIQNNDILSKLRDNEAITVGFEKITQIGGDLQISENNALANLNGLENLSSVGGKLIISTNANLSDCKGICNILEKDGVTGSIFIISNPSGCSNQADVEAECMVGNSDIIASNRILLSPNPVEHTLHISNVDNQWISEIVIFDQFGKELIHTSKTQIDVKSLASGIYFVKVKIGNQFAFQKFLKF